MASDSSNTGHKKSINGIPGGNLETPGSGGSEYEPSIRVSLHETNGQLITKLEATDPDEGANGRVVYGLRRHGHSRARVNRAAGDFLSVDENTGEVWLKRALLEEDLGPHLFVVSANDQGAPMPRSENKVSVDTSLC